jgi:5-hydroxyisourate hydrolase-like protein (transthyretin family)
MVLMAGLVACSGCSVISGTVTDADSGAPLSEVRVGVMVLRPGNFEPEFQERARTDGEGRYRLVYGFGQSSVSFRLEDYLSHALADPTDPSSLDVVLQSIATIKGTWNAAITVEGETIPASSFEFDENGMHWRAGSDSLGIVRYEFDGEAISINNVLLHGDVVEGELVLDLVLNEAGDTLSGDITFSEGLFAGTGCESDCSGTVVAVAAGK